MVPAGGGGLTPVRRRALVGLAALAGLLLVFLWRSRPPRSAADPSAGGFLEIRFTRPVLEGPRPLRGGPDAALAEAIDGAQTSVDMAVYDLDLWSVRDALLRADERGVSVRLVVEADNLGSPEVYDLIAAGIPLVADGWDWLMHDKFTVIDRSEVWTGSMNYTVRDGYFNDNNLLRLVSSDVAQAYADEFDEMFLEETFGPFSPPGQGRRAVLGDGTEVEVYFAPDDRPRERLLTLVNGARERIDFLAFAFTSPELAQAMIARHLLGVGVRGVLESGQAASLGTQWEALRLAGVDVRLDGNPDNMHHKVIVIDAAVVVTGSYNFSRSAEEFNDENLLVLHSPEAAGRFLEEIDRIYDLAR